jgi:hypothetical protein
MIDKRVEGDNGSHHHHILGMTISLILTNVKVVGSVDQTHNQTQHS